MVKFKIETRIVILALVIGAAVITSGYFAYRSLFRIVYTIHREALPDNSLFLIKDVSNDLGLLENNIRLSVLTNKKSDLDLCDSVLLQITQRLDYLKTTLSGSREDSMMIASFRDFAQEKQEIWKEILNLHLTHKGITPRFSQFYSRLEMQKTDTLITQQEKKGFLRKLLGISKTISDTTYIKHEPDKEEIKREISGIEKEFVNNNKDLEAIESRLLAKNMILDKKISNLIRVAENRKAGETFRRTKDVDRLAAFTYNRLMAFTAFSVILLLISILMLLGFLKRSRTYQHVLQDARQKAENLALAKEQFVANVSHELRTPVSVIYGLTEQMMQNPLDPGIKELVTVISRSSEHLKKIVTDTLEFSKIEAGKIKLESVVFSPHEICEEVVAIHRMEASRKGIDLNFIWNGENQLAVSGDPFRLRQILINLIGNAVKFTEKGKVTLKISVEETMNDFSCLDIMVEDTGIGISESDLKIIFDEFVQAEHPSGKKFSGTGLGLSIVRRLVELQGGQIEIKSEPAKGTRVHVIMNYGKADRKDLPITGAVELKVLPFFENISVLIADDDEFNTFLVKKILTKWGVKSYEVNNGSDAVTAALNGKFDVILMDLRMPGMDGLTAAKSILKEKPGTFIVAISATGEENAKEATENAGMRHFMSKPFSEKELYDILAHPGTPEDENPDQPDFPIATAELERLAGEDYHFLEEMILLFIRSSETTVNHFQEYLRTGDLVSMAEDAHKIASSCRQIGAQTLYDLIKKLEEIAKQKDETRSLPDVIQAVASETERVNTFLKKYLRKLDT